MKDKDIVSGIKSGTGSGWNELFGTPQKNIRAQIQPILGGVADVTFDDVFQEACIVLMENIKAGKIAAQENTNLAGYLFVLCKRIALRYAGKKKTVAIREMAGEGNDGKRPGVVLRDPGCEDDGAAPEEKALEEEEAFAFLERVMASIPETCRTILRRFYWDRLPMTEIAALTGLKNENTAKTTKNRCMDKFRNIAKAMMEDDEKAEEAIRRTIERSSLRAELEEYRREWDGSTERSELRERVGKMSEDEIIEGIRSNSPQAWRALYASFYDNLKKEIDPLIK